MALFSIIIPTFNRREWIERSVAALLRQIDRLSAEILILDDGSSDDTPSFLEKISAENPNIRFFLLHGLGPARLRNLGAKHSRGGVLCFLDDDSVPEPGWFDALKSSVETLSASTAAIKGYVLPYQETSPLPVFLGKYIHVSDSWATNNIAFIKEIFCKAGGFDEQFTFAAWEDLDLGFRLERMGYHRTYNPAMVIRHPHEENLEKLRRKFKINGYGFFQFCRKWIKIDRRWVIRMWVERLRVSYYLLPGMNRIDLLRYIHGLRLRYEIYGLIKGLLSGGSFARSTKD